MSMAKKIEMTPEAVAVEVDEILALYFGSPECAHLREDELLKQIIDAATCGLDVKMICREAARLLETKRTKWYA